MVTGTTGPEWSLAPPNQNGHWHHQARMVTGATGPEWSLAPPDQNGHWHNRTRYDEQPRTWIAVSQQVRIGKHRLSLVNRGF